MLIKTLNFTAYNQEKKPTHISVIFRVILKNILKKFRFVLFCGITLSMIEWAQFRFQSLYNPRRNVFYLQAFY